MTMPDLQRYPLNLNRIQNVDNNLVFLGFKSVCMKGQFELSLQPFLEQENCVFFISFKFKNVPDFVFSNVATDRSIN